MVNKILVITAIFLATIFLVAQARALEASGLLKEIKEGNKVLFQIDGDTVSFRADKIDRDGDVQSIRFTIDAKNLDIPIRDTLLLGGTQQYDTNADGNNDLEVFVMDILGSGEATLLFTEFATPETTIEPASRRIETTSVTQTVEAEEETMEKEEATSEETGTEAITGEAVSESESDDEGGSTATGWIILIAIVAVGLIAYVSLRKKPDNP